MKMKQYKSVERLSMSVFRSLRNPAQT